MSGDDGAAPRAEVLGGEILAEPLLDVLVDVVGVEVAPPPPVLVGEQAVAAAASAQQRVEHRPHAVVAHGDLHLLPGLRRIAERQAAAVAGDVVLLDRGEAVAVVLLGVAVRTDAEHAEVEQRERRGRAP